MQAKPQHTSIPFQFPSPIKLPPLNKVQYPASTIPKAISISTPNTDQISIPSAIDVLDDSIAAFWDYQFLFVSQRAETADPAVLRVVDGAIPADFPSGKYYLAGPGLFSDDHGSTVHPLDGHGYLRAFVFDGGAKEVRFMAKYVKTEAQMEEHDPATDTWRFTHRGPFSVLKGGRKVGNTKVMKNVANTSVLRWGGRLLCLWEGGDPYEIEPETLDTVGNFDAINDRLGSTPAEGHNNGDIWDMAARLLKPVLYGVFKMPRQRLLSHYKIDAKRNRLLILSCNAEDMLLPRSNFTFYEFDRHFKLVEKQDYSIPDHLMIHDWAFTDSHYVLFANRMKLDVLGAMGAVSGICPMISALSVNPSKGTSPIYVLPRFAKQHCGINRDWREALQIPSRLWLLHVGNAFEVRDDHANLDIQIHASACSYQWFNFHNLFGYDWQSGKLDPSIMNKKQSKSEQFPHLVHISITLSSDGQSLNCSVNPLNHWTKSSDFPAINPAFSGLRNRYLYAATSSGCRPSLPSFPFDMVVKLDTVTNSVRSWSAGNRRFVGEPVFVPTGDGEDDGYVIVVEYAVSIQRCYLIILDARKIGEADAVVARLEVPKHLNFPLGFHGFWAAT